MENHFVLLLNEKSAQIGFDRQRNVGGATANNADVEVDYIEPKIIQEFQKERLRLDNVSFEFKRISRQRKRTISLPHSIDLIQIHFFKVFDLDLQKQFSSKYGISPIEYFDFNKTVLFQVEDSARFENFRQHIIDVLNSKENVTYQNQRFNLIALIYNFKFIDDEERLRTIDNNGVLLTLLTTHLGNVYLSQKKILFQLLENASIKYNYNDNTPDLIEISRISTEIILEIAKNIDIVKTITSSRSEKIRPGILGPIREYGFEVIVSEQLNIVGVIDTGVAKIEPLKDLILEDSYNHTKQPPFWDEVGHGTMVAGLIVLGEDYYLHSKPQYAAKAKILNIKALHFNADDLNIPQLIADVKDAKRRLGVRIFNMSLVIPNAKKYNSSYSHFAYELDKLAYEEDILMFLSVGNFDADSLNDLKNVYSHPDHEYPDFFYKLNSTSDSHVCEDTNICVPSESLNNISIGALAGNFELLDNSDITPVALYPAHYTRKFHFDYDREVNSTVIKQRNSHLNKPDFVFEGGDLFLEQSGIQILRSPMADRDRYFGKTSGTSLSTPLLTSYACEILNKYPTIKSQTLKAILVNSASYFANDKLEHFKNYPEAILKSLVGFGKPERSKLLYTDKHSIGYIIENKIKVHEIIKIPIFLPEYLLVNGNKLQFDITLCYSFMPIKDNHLSYLPLHMAFNIVKNVDIKDVAKKKQDYALKSNHFPWSEDHFGIDNRLFSNTQRKTFRLQPNDINVAGGSVALAIRCLAKHEFESSLSKQEHSFSIVVRVTEIMKNENESGLTLYSEMLKLNNFASLSSQLSLNIDADNDAELDT